MICFNFSFYTYAKRQFTSLWCIKINRLNIINIVIASLNNIIMETFDLITTRKGDKLASCTDEVIQKFNKNMATTRKIVTHMKKNLHFNWIEIFSLDSENWEINRFQWRIYIVGIQITQLFNYIYAVASCELSMLYVFVSIHFVGLIPTICR